MVFPQDLIARSQEPDVAEILKGEQVLFEARIQTRANQKQQLGERITGLRQESAGNTAQAEAKAREIALIKKELDGLEGLERQQLARTDWPLLLAAAVVMTAPIIALFVLAQRFFWPGDRLGGLGGR